MKIKRLHIKNYKSIKELEIDDAQDALILVGRNNSGKSVILDAIRVAVGSSDRKSPACQKRKIPGVHAVSVPQSEIGRASCRERV